MPSPVAQRTGRTSWSRWYPHVEGSRAGRSRGEHSEIDEPKSVLDAPSDRVSPHETAAIDASAPRRLVAAMLLFVAALLTWISVGTSKLARKLSPRRAPKAPPPGALTS